jgi:hypothetical protein
MSFGNKLEYFLLFSGSVLVPILESKVIQEWYMTNISACRYPVVHYAN